LGGKSGETSSQSYGIPKGNWQLDAQSLAVETMQFLEGTDILLLGLLERETALRLGGQPVDHLCAIYELSWLMGNGSLAHEHYTILEMNSRSTVRMTDWENCAIF